MLVNFSYNSKEITQKVDALVGKPFNLKERRNLQGVESPKLVITATSLEIQHLLILNNASNSCRIELRPKGIIVRFRSLLETFALIVPFYKLNICKSDFALYTLHKDHYFIKVKSDTKAIQKFFRKILTNKAHNSPSLIMDL